MYAIFLLSRDEDWLRALIINPSNGAKRDSFVAFIVLDFVYESNAVGPF